MWDGTVQSEFQVLKKRGRERERERETVREGDRELSYM